MKVLLNIIFSTFGALGNLTLVLLIVIYIFSVMGMQVIGNRYSPMAFDADEDPANFPRSTDYADKQLLHYFSYEIDFLTLIFN